MNRLLLAALLLSSLAIPGSPFAAEPLRVFIRSGPKSHGPGAHDHPSFLRDWVPLLNERGAKATGGNNFPSKEQLDQTDVLILHTDNGGDIRIGEERKNLLEFLKRGGGIVSIHAANVSKDHDWFKTIIGGSWHHGQTKWLEGPMHLYFTDRENPITREMSNFEMDDEIYYDMDVLPECRILAAAYTPKPRDTGGKGNREAQARAAEAVKKGGVNIYDIQPQVWTYEKDSHRAFVCIPGHYYANFNRPNFRALLLRGIAWAGKRENADELCRPDELGDNLRYVEGGPTHPSRAAAKLEVHPEFNISLVAAEPLINKPMNLDWDAKGRLWVCETPEYPNGRRELNVEAWKDSGSWTKKLDRDPIDRISILSDANGDGVMDSKQVFADKLELVTSFCFYKNGVIAAAAPDIWFLEDTNGDDVADKRTKLYTGLGTRDTHAVINNLRWGLDGWIYATHGYSAGEVQALGAPDKPSVGIGSGVCRFRPDGTEIEMYSSRGGNTWGLDITRDGQLFFTQPTSGTVFFHVVLPEYILAKGKLPGTNSWHGMITGQTTYPLMTWPEQAYVQIDQVGQFTAAAGCAIYEGGAWPAKWNYSYFTTEPTLNIVHHEFVEKDGVTYKTRKEPGREATEFIRSKDLWFRPIEVRVGPDGALYVIDFYNQAVIHNDTRGPIHGPANAAVRPDRDHYYGRIWKVQHKNAKPVRAEAAYRHRPGAKAAQGSPALRSYEVRKSADIPSALAAYAAASDDWTRSAIIGALADRARHVLVEALKSDSHGSLGSLVSALLPSGIAQPDSVGALIEACANADSKADALKIIILQGVAQQSNEVPALTPELTEALKNLLAQPALAPAALPLVAKWDKGGTMADVIKAQIARLSATLGNNGSPLPDRIGAAKALVGLGGSSAQIGVEALADPTSPEELARAVIAALDATGNAAPLVPALDTLKPQLLQIAFDAILKRPDATLALLASIQDGRVDSRDLGPGNVARLRTHPNKQVARRANAMIDKLNPVAKAKNELIAQFTPIVEQPGDPAKGRIIFTAACAICHKLGDVGKDVAPPLVGMGAHGPAELLIHIVDPNREVDPSFWAWNITKKNGETLAGVITSENQASLNLRNQAGDFEIRKEDIATRENTHRSLMPEGLEGLGAENIRDVLAFICGDAMKRFRILHLADACTADSREGVFKGPKPNEGQVRLARFGNVTVEGIPFFIQDPVKSATGANIIVLKGGPNPGNHSQTFPARVEIPVNVETKRLQLLSGVSGWGFPAVRDELIALHATVVYANGETEGFALRNGVDFADYIRRIDVPGSQYVDGITDDQQMRLITLKLTKKGVAKRLILESPSGNKTAPVVVAITADIEGHAEAKRAAGTPVLPRQTGGAPGKNKAVGDRNPVEGPAAPDSPKQGARGDGPLVPATPVTWEPGKTRVLVIGGGSSHDFASFFGTTDVATLKDAGFTVHYTEDRDQAAAELSQAHVAVISVNRKFFDTAAYRKALMDFAAAGKGIVMLHPGTWYGYASWPELNAQIVGGGARGHDKIHPFDVRTLDASHPVMAGVPAVFTVEDELYHVNAEPDKIPASTAKIHALAETSPSDKFKTAHPSIWITQHPKARIVGIALGHDQRTHDHDAFKKVLVNAARWVSRD